MWPCIHVYMNLWDRRRYRQTLENVTFVGSCRGWCHDSGLLMLLWRPCIAAACAAWPRGEQVGPEYDRISWPCRCGDQRHALDK
jgi:hypothetical protein